MKKNLYYINAYVNTFSVIELYDGSTFPLLLARIENNVVTFATKQALKKNWINKGLPNLAVAIKGFLS